jgi:hypothetical protein
MMEVLFPPPSNPGPSAKACSSCGHKKIIQRHSVICFRGGEGMPNGWLQKENGLRLRAWLHTI